MENWLRRAGGHLPPIAETEEEGTRSNTPENTAIQSRNICDYSSNVEEKQETVLRFGVQNMNGIQQDRPSREMIKEALARLKLDCAGMVETQLNWNKHWIRDEFHADLERNFANVSMTFAACTGMKQTTKQAGGVCMASRSRIASRIVAQGQDPKQMGRWCYQRVLLHRDRHLTIITAYQVCQKHPSGQGETTAFMQQYLKLMEQRLKADPRAAMLKDLCKFIRDQKSTGDDILLMWDANTSIRADEMIDFMEATGLVDLHDDLILAEEDDDEPELETYIRGRRRIDFIFGTPALAEMIVKAGILGYDDGFPRSDHRLLYVDLDETKLFRGKSIDATKPRARELNSNHEERVAEYTDLVLQQFQYHRVYDRASRLIQEVQETARPMTVDKIQYFKQISDAIDRDVTKAVLYAEKQVSNASYGYPYSPKLANLGRELLFWKHRLRDLNRFDDAWANMPLFEIERRGLNLVEAGKREFIINCISDATFNLKTAQTRSTQHRKKYLEEKMEEAEAAGDNKRAQRFRNILVGEAKKRMWKKIGRYVSDKTHTPLTRVEVPVYDNDGNITGRESITETEKLHQALLEQNKKHFSQAQDTPFVTGPLREVIHPFQQNAVTESILDGTFDPSEYLEDEMAIKFIQHLRYPDGQAPDNINTEISAEDFKAAIKSISEKTSSSPSGRHYGHYKAALGDETILAVYAILASVPFQCGFALDRWTHAVQVMIEKLRGRPWIEKLRVIQLIEADLNIAAKIIFPDRLQKSAEEKGTLPKNQYGNRAGHMSISAVLVKRLMWDLAVQLRIDQIGFNNDLKGCYDRMVPVVAALGCRRQGLTKEAADALLAILYHMKYKIRTALGLSEEEFSNLVTWILGTLQGAGWSTTCWLMLTAVLLAVLEERSNGVVHTNPRGTMSIKKTGEAYVDDTDLWTTLPDGTFLELAEYTQQKAQEWRDTIFTSGGDLGLPKCFWNSIKWIWEGGLPRMATIEESPGEIRLRAGTDITSQLIQRYEHDVGRRTLGVFLAPNGSDKANLDYLLAKGKRFKRNLAAAALTRTEGRMAFEGVITKSMGYPLGGTNFTRDECDKIQKTVTTAALRKMGYMGSTKRTLVFGPAEYGGLDYTDFWTDQGIQHISLILGHLRNQDEAGTLLEISKEWMQLMIGRGEALFTYKLDTVKKYIPRNYLMGTWEFLLTIDAQLEFPNGWKLELQRERDRFLMGDIADKLQLTPKDLKRMNACRMYLQVITLADIVDGSGKFILDEYLRGHRRQDRHSKYEWPNQERPDAKAWATWAWSLRKLFTLPRTNKLKITLGRWTSNPIHQQWQDFYDPRGDRLIRIDANEIVMTHTKALTRNNFNREFDIIENAPSGTVPITIKHVSPTLIATTGHATMVPQHQVATDTHHDHPLLQAISEMPERYQDLIGECCTLPNAEQLQIMATEIAEGTGVTSTDGSVRRVAGTHSWIIHATQNDVRLEGFAKAAATGQHPSSMRMEAEGRLASLLVVKAIVTAPGIEFPMGTEIVLQGYIDNKAVIFRSQTANWKGPGACIRDEWEIYHEVEQISRELNLTSPLEHVKSHQDDDKPYEELSFQAKLNVDADRLAEQAHALRQPTMKSLPSERVILTIGGKRITRRLKKEIKNASRAQELREYIIAQAGWDETPDNFDCVDWAMSERARRNLTNSRKIMVFKLQHDLLPTNEVLHTRKESGVDHRCPRCGSFYETFDHVLQCSSQEACRDREELWKEADKEMRKTRPPQYIHEKLKEGIRQWQENGVVEWIWEEPVDEIGEYTKAAFEEQDALGWRHAMRGRLSIKWREVIVKYHQDRQEGEESINFGEAWATNNIKALINLSCKLWLRRCDQVHGKTDAERRAKEMAKLDKEIEEAFANDKPDIPANQQHFFRGGIEQVKRKSLENKRQWLALVHAAAAVARETNATDVERMRRSMTKYLRRARRPTARIRS